MPKRRAKPAQSHGQPGYVPKQEQQVGNELQRKLFVEVHDSVRPGAGTDLLDQPGVLADWLRIARVSLLYLARLGEGVANQSTLLEQTLQLAGEMRRTPQDVVAWIDEYPCLRELVGTEALRYLDFKARQVRFQQLSTLSQDL